MPRQPNSGSAPEGVELRDVSRLVRKLRRKVYRETPVASANRTAELDPRMSYLDMTTALGAAKLGVPSRGAALALWRACNDRGLRAWCYEFGFPESLTQTVTVVDVDGVLEVHDAFFNSSYRPGLSDLLTSLRDGRAVNGKDGIRDRKIYIMDPAGEAQATVCWLEAHADRELEPVDGLRRFQVLWNPEAFAATYPAIDVVSRGLAARGYPEELQFLKLHPVAMFDGARWHRDHADMPLLGGQDLTSPVAALRVATRDLATERARVAETAMRITCIEADLADVNSRLSAASHQFVRRTRDMASAKGGAASGQERSRGRAQGDAYSVFGGGRSTGSARQPDRTAAGRDRGYDAAIRSTAKRASRLRKPGTGAGRPRGYGSKPKIATCGRGSLPARKRTSKCASLLWSGSGEPGRPTSMRSKSATALPR